MKIKKRLPTLLAVFMLFASITSYANEVNNQIIQEQKQELDVLAYMPINPMGLPDIDPITNPARIIS